MGLTFFLFAMSVGGLSYVSHLDSLELRNISVSGTNMLSATAVRGVVDEQLSGRVSGIFSKRNVLLYPKSAIEAHLQEKFPALASAELESAGITSGDLLVSIQEREAFALWCAGMLESSCFAIDTTGFVFASAFQAQALDAGLLVFRGSLATTTDTIGAHVLPGEFQNVMSTIDALSRVVPGPASVHIENEKISLRYPSGLLVHFTTERSNNPEVLAANFRIALESEALSGVPHERIEYIDLRFENRLYYRLRGSSAQETDSAE
jgi:cell division septal protein FtsQ